MKRPLVDQIADAVLYEGYLLYPYRPSVKNRQRWTFGGLYPRAYSEAHAGTDAWTLQTECLVEGGEGTRLSVRVRFLHLQLRRTEGPVTAGPATWQEAVEREADPGDLAVGDLAARAVVRDVDFPSRREEELLADGEGRIVREQHAIRGAVEISAQRAADSLYKLTVRVRNDTTLAEAGVGDRDEAVLRALVSTHAILGVRDGGFVSMIDPPERWRAIAATCRNVGSWPVLVGEPDSRDTMLSTPIILYDYPQVAPESPGDLFDATEIDEMLTLRILTLTEDEKRAMGAIDERARAMLERTESLAREQLTAMHGTIRGLNPL